MDNNIPSTPPLSKGIAIFTMVMIILIGATSYLAYPPEPKYDLHSSDLIANETITDQNVQQITLDNMYPHEES